MRRGRSTEARAPGGDRPGDGRVPDADVRSAGARAASASMTRTFGQPPVQLRTLGGSGSDRPVHRGARVPGAARADRELRQQPARGEREPAPRRVLRRHRHDRRGAADVSTTSRERAAAMRIDINCDMGESFGPWRMGADAQRDAAHHLRQHRLRRARRRSGRDAPDGAARARGRRRGRRASGVRRPAGIRPARDDDRSRRGRGLAHRADRRAGGDREGRRRAPCSTSSRTARSTTWRRATARWPTRSRARSRRSTRR